jgi:hypothetical protein
MVNFICHYRDKSYKVKCLTWFAWVKGMVLVNLLMSQAPSLLIMLLHWTLIFV